MSDFKRGLAALAPEAQAEWVRQRADELHSRACLAEDRLAIARAALTWIRDHEHDEEALAARAECGNAWHADQRHMVDEGDDPLGGRCPECFSKWWACYDTRPYEEGSYALGAVAAAALAEEAARG